MSLKSGKHNNRQVVLLAVLVMAIGLLFAGFGTPGQSIEGGCGSFEENTSTRSAQPSLSTLGLPATDSNSEPDGCCCFWNQHDYEPEEWREKSANSCFGWETAKGCLGSNYHEGSEPPSYQCDWYPLPCPCDGEISESEDSGLGGGMGMIG